MLQKITWYLHAEKGLNLLLMNCKYEKQISHHIVLQQYFHWCVHFHHNSDRFALPALRICRYRIQCNHRGSILRDTRNLHRSLWIKRTSFKIQFHRNKTTVRFSFVFCTMLRSTKTVQCILLFKSHPKKSLVHFHFLSLRDLLHFSNYHIIFGIFCNSRHCAAPVAVVLPFVFVFAPHSVQSSSPAAEKLPSPHSTQCSDALRP